MQIQIHASAFDLTDAIRNHIEQKVGLALDWSQDALTKIHFRLADINGPRGGKDKSCQIQLILNGKKELIIKDVQTDLYLAIDRTIERAARVLARKIARYRQINH